MRRSDDEEEDGTTANRVSANDDDDDGGANPSTTMAPQHDATRIVWRMVFLVMLLGGVSIFWFEGRRPLDCRNPRNTKSYFSFATTDVRRGKRAGRDRDVCLFSESGKNNMTTSRTVHRSHRIPAGGGR